MNDTGARRVMARIVAIHAPPTPRCFDDRDRWVTYLESAQQSRKPGRKPFVGEVYRVQFNFCADCSTAWKAQMLGEGRCTPEAYIAALSAGQVVRVEGSTT